MRLVTCINDALESCISYRDSANNHLIEVAVIELKRRISYVNPIVTG